MINWVLLVFDICNQPTLNKVLNTKTKSFVGMQKIAFAKP